MWAFLILSNNFYLTITKLNFLHKAMVFQLVLEEFIQQIRTFVIFSFWGVVGFAICQHPLHISNKKSLVDVVVRLKSLRHGFQVDGELDVIVVVGHSFSVHRVEKWPGGLVVPAGGQDRLQGVVQLVGVNLLVTVLGCPKERSS